MSIKFFPSADGKADKVAGAVSGNLAGLDSTGNLTDSGVSATQAGILDGEVNTYADLPTPGVANDGQVYLVKTTTGIRFINQKAAGFWVSNAVTWSLIAPLGDTLVYSDIVSTMEVASTDKVLCPATTLAGMVVPTPGTRPAYTVTDTILTAFGIIKSWLNDLVPVAFSGSATDLGSGTLNNARLPSTISISGTITGSRLISTVATGTAPISVTSTTEVANLTAATATILATARTIGGVSFNGSANIVPQTITSASESSDTTCFPLFFTASGTQSLQPKTNTALTFNSSTGALGATSFVGSGAALTGVTSVRDEAAGYIATWTTSSNSANQVPTGGVLAYNNSPSAITVNTIDELAFNLTATGTYIVTLFFYKSYSDSIAQCYPAVRTGGTSTTPGLAGSTLISVGKVYSGSNVQGPFTIILPVVVTAATVKVQPKFSQSASVSTDFLGIFYQIYKVS